MGNPKALYFMSLKDFYSLFLRDVCGTPKSKTDIIKKMRILYVGCGHEDGSLLTKKRRISSFVNFSCWRELGVSNYAPGPFFRLAT